jgi:ADP-ribose pyrophosphatase
MKIDRSYRKSTVPEHAQCKFEGVLFDVYQWEQELYDGSKTTFEKLIRDDTVIALPILEDGRILLTLDAQPGREPYLTAPGGRVDPGETPEVAARRELLEETGYVCETLTLIYERKPEEKLDWLVYSFVARGCSKQQEANPGAGERIELKPVTFEEFLELAYTGRLHSEWEAAVLEAKLDPQKMQQLRSLLSP